MKKVKLKLALNGLELEVEGGDGPNKKIVFQTSGSKKDEVENFAEFLHYLNHTFGPSTDDTSPACIQISVRPGKNNTDWTEDEAEIDWPPEKSETDFN